MVSNERLREADKARDDRNEKALADAVVHLNETIDRLFKKRSEVLSTNISDTEAVRKVCDAAGFRGVW